MSKFFRAALFVTLLLISVGLSTFALGAQRMRGDES